MAETEPTPLRPATAERTAERDDETAAAGHRPAAVAPAMAPASAPPAAVAPVAVPTAYYDDSVLDLRRLLRALFRFGWIILIAGALGAVYGLNWLHDSKPVYIASMILEPSNEQEGLQLRGGALNGLVQNLAVGVKKQTMLDRLDITFGSPALAARLQDRTGLMQTIYADSWDSDSARWVRPSGKDFERDQRINRFLRQRLWSAPTVEDFAAFLGEAIEVEEIEQTGIFIISTEQTDPRVALQMLSVAFQEAQDLLRRQDIAEVQRRRSYLNEQLRRTSIVETRTAILALLMNEEHSLMMLQPDQSFVGRVLEAPRLNPHPKPRSLLFYLGVPIFVAVSIAVLGITLVVVFRSE